VADSVTRVDPQDVDTTTMPILDVRKHPGKEQIRGALRYDAKALLTEERLALPLPHDGRIVVYGDSESEAEQIAQRLRDQGYEGASVLAGGFDAYKSMDLQTEEVTVEQPVPGNESAGVPRI